MWNIKALALTVQKLLAWLMSQWGEQNDRQDKNNMPPPILDLGGIMRNIYDNNGDEDGQREGSFSLQLKWAKTESIQRNDPRKLTFPDLQYSNQRVDVYCLLKSVLSFCSWWKQDLFVYCCFCPFEISLIWRRHKYQ